METEATTPDDVSASFRASAADLLARAPSAVRLATEFPRAALGVQLMLASVPLLPKTAVGDGHPVLVLPGLSANDTSTLALRQFLRLRGFRPYAWHLGRNVGPTAAVRAELPVALQRIARRNRSKVSIIGWSLGGIYARQLAHEFPDSVRQVITLATPYRLQRFDQSRADSIYTRFRHLHAVDETQTTATGRSAFPLSVPTTSIYSREDGIVAWQHCIEPPTDHSENIRVCSSHLSIGFDPHVLFAIADRLAQPEGDWQPFRPPSLLRPFFPRPDNPHGAADVVA
ncbi:triacylglycerol lipase [Yimella sp. cx-51]|uniref:esterase/lipase family protein n=1 Tax=Yimella sp. cx-51 TaxID=2770551 RepID=UPI001AD88EF9|nr:hypothetical protein [Yimella sp. cx-51]QTH38629.1 hypothetical protein J5M86_02930 [Yimella sp. cx-51]